MTEALPGSGLGEGASPPPPTPQPQPQPDEPELIEEPQPALLGAAGHDTADSPPSAAPIRLWERSDTPDGDLVQALLASRPPAFAALNRQVAEAPTT